MPRIMFPLVRNPKHAKAGASAYESNYYSARITPRSLRFHSHKKPFNLIRGSRLFFISFCFLCHVVADAMSTFMFTFREEFGFKLFLVQDCEPSSTVLITQ